MIAKIWIILVPSVALLALSSTTWPRELIFKNRGKLIKTLSSEQLEKIIPAKTIKVFDQDELENRKYNGFPVNDLFTAVYGENWKYAE